MKLKLTQPGYEGFTGTLGAVEFTDGLSNYGVSPQQAGGITITIRGELVDDVAVVPEDPENP